MPSFQVDVRELDELACNLQSIRDQLGVWDDRRGTMDGDFAAVGDTRLQSVLRDFYKGWSDGAADIKSALDSAITGLRKASQHYRDTENAVVQSISIGTTAGS
jgi:hypothetical protein